LRRMNENRAGRKLLGWNRQSGRGSIAGYTPGRVDGGRADDGTLIF
jgi:hypothetical protein